VREILAWCQLRFPLAEIKALVEHPSHDRSSALRRPRGLVESELGRSQMQLERCCFGTKTESLRRALQILSGNLARAAAARYGAIDRQCACEVRSVVRTMA
jgi:DNA-binding transcriptional MerR regulator